MVEASASGKTALLLVDLQNDFLTDSGFKNFDEDKSLVRDVKRLVAYARSNEIPVVWIYSVYGEWDTPPEPRIMEKPAHFDQQLLNSVHLSGSHPKKNCCLRDSKGSRLVNWAEKIRDREKDHLVEKHFYSAFTETVLLELLRDTLQVTDVLVGGVATTTCIRATCCDAFAHHFRVHLVQDCARAKNEGLHWDAVKLVEQHYCQSVVNSYELGPRQMQTLHVVNETRLYTNVCQETNVYSSLIHEVNWHTMDVRGSPVPRLVALQGQLLPDGSAPLYRHPADQQPPVVPWTPLVGRLRELLLRHFGFRANHVLVQHYRSSADNIGEHSDKTLDIVPGSCVVNFSFGATRVMTLKSKARDAAGQHKFFRCAMPSGSVFMLDLVSNIEYFHGIRSDKRPAKVKDDDELYHGGGRISLTFRSIGTFVSPEGRVFGQGSPVKSLEEPQLQITPAHLRQEQQRMVNAFSTENQSGLEFDWNATYGKGFFALDLNELNGNSERFQVDPSKLTLFFVNGSIPSWRVLLLLNEAGIQHTGRRLRVMRKPKDTRNPLFLQINPRGKTPTLVDVDGSVCVESLAILQYLHYKYQALPLITAKVLSRVQESENLQRAYSPVEKVFNQAKMTPEQMIAAKNAPQDILKELHIWDSYASEAAFIGGTDEITLADCAFFPCLEYIIYRGFHLHPKRFANLTRYRDMMKRRPGVASSEPAGWEEGKGVNLFNRLPTLSAKNVE